MKKLLTKINLWWNSLFKYKLSKKERELYNSILNKDAMGYGEWYFKTHGDDICGHWIKDITEEEMALLDKIHKHFFGEDWWIAIPMSNAQVYAVILDDIKDKVK